MRKIPEDVVIVDFLGTEFLLWLWYNIDVKNGDIKCVSGKRISIWSEDKLQIKGSKKYDFKGSDLMNDSVSKLALKENKKIKSASFELNIGERNYIFSLDSDYNIKQIELPEVYDDDIFPEWERLALLDEFYEVIDDVFKTFVAQRVSTEWYSMAELITEWMDEEVE